MPFVVNENCIKCKYTDCIEVCPVDCFHEGPNMLVIDPDECIDCCLCETECPPLAIQNTKEMADKEEAQKLIDFNREFSQEWPVLATRKDPLPDADEWKGVSNKIQYLEK